LLWTLTTVAHVVPFVGVAVLLVVLEPLAAPVSLVALTQAWIIPELYAQRGSNVVRPRSRPDGAPERRALGLLGDLVEQDARELLARTGVVLEQGRLGTWLVGEAGAVLVRPTGGTAGHLARSRVFCFCVRTAENDLPWADRIAHLLLALRSDEAGFATVANLAFSGARWRLRRRLPFRVRPALDAAARVAAGA
jgi:hypothetical protein